jgi:signal transduction histidine kinase
VPIQEARPTADLFASLAERGAALVDRQHDVLEALQHREEDPQRLAGLFSLDHLAAQLRRNNNAALVLAGLPTIRSIHAPTLLSELAYAAVSEVNGYQRVSMGAFPTRRVQAHVASDLVHVLGDLLENALAVSPRSGGVWVRGARPATVGTDAPTLVSVGDSGNAVPDAALEELNDMLAGRVDHLRTGHGVGLVVTREIARRHSLAVDFRRLVTGGLVATVALHDALFEPTGMGTPLTQTDDRITSMQASIATTRQAWRPSSDSSERAETSTPPKGAQAPTHGKVGDIAAHP